MLEDWTVIADNHYDHGRKCLEVKSMIATEEDWKQHENLKGRLFLTVTQNDTRIYINIEGGYMDYDIYKFYPVFSTTFDAVKREAEAIPEPVTTEWLLENGFEFR